MCRMELQPFGIPRKEKINKKMLSELSSIYSAILLGCVESITVSAMHITRFDNANLVSKWSMNFRYLHLYANIFIVHKIN